MSKRRSVPRPSTLMHENMRQSVRQEFFLDYGCRGSCAIEHNRVKQLIELPLIPLRLSWRMTDSRMIGKSILDLRLEPTRTSSLHSMSKTLSFLSKHSCFITTTGTRATRCMSRNNFIKILNMKEFNTNTGSSCSAEYVEKKPPPPRIVAWVAGISCFPARTHKILRYTYRIMGSSLKVNSLHEKSIGWRQQLVWQRPIRNFNVCAASVRHPSRAAATAPMGSPPIRSFNTGRRTSTTKCCWIPRKRDQFLRTKRQSTRPRNKHFRSFFFFSRICRSTES